MIARDLPLKRAVDGSDRSKPEGGPARVSVKTAKERGPPCLTASIGAHHCNVGTPWRRRGTVQLLGPRRRFRLTVGSAQTCTAGIQERIAGVMPE
jgi:hypothetical protein